MADVTGMIPDKINNYNLYSGTAAKENKLLGITDEFKCPEVEFLTETLNMAGFGGEFDSPAIGQIKNMEMEIKFTNVSKEGLEVAADDTKPIIARSAQEFINPENGQKIMRNRTTTIYGMTKKIDYGKLKKAGMGEPSITKSITYYEETIDGETVTKINKLTGDCIVAGKDLTKELQKYI